MKGPEKNKWGNHLFSPTLVRSVQTINKKDIQHGHRSTKERKNNHQKQMKYKKHEILQVFHWALRPQGTDQIPQSEYLTDQTGRKFTN